MIIHVDILMLAVVLVCFYVLNRKLNKVKNDLRILIRETFKDTPIPDGWEKGVGKQTTFCSRCRAMAPREEFVYNKEKKQYYHRHCLPVQQQ